MKRPAGFTLVVALAILLGIAQVVVSLGYFNIANLASLQTSWLQGDLSSVISTAAYAMGAALAALGLAGIVFAIGALGMRTWAWTLGVAVYLLGVAGAIFMLFMTGTAVAAAVTGVLSAIFAWYLSTDDVRDAFGQEVRTAGGHRPHAV
jgi:hypothetical protein